MMSISTHLYVCIIVCFLINVTLVDTQYRGFFNAARGRPTWQSSDHNNCTSDRAVDGCLDGNLDNKCCTHTQNTAKTWWSVDLGQNYTIRNVRLFNRDKLGYRLQQFKIFTSFTSGQPSKSSDKEECANKDSEVGNYVDLACFKRARYILIEKTIPKSWSEKYYALTLCEVQVLAECQDGTYGLNCTKICSPHCRDGSACDKETGSCPGGKCSAGYQGSKCDQKCQDGKYGIDCNNTCSPQCTNGANCDKETGSCPGGKCSVGYRGSKCDQVCEDGYYGPDCIHQCSTHCAEACDKFSYTGSCSGNCMDGYIADNCTVECEAGSYGPKCQSRCFGNCNGPCDIVNGVCRVGCIQGWTGQMCDIKDSTTTIIIAVLGGSGIITVIIVGTVIYMKLAKHRRNTALTDAVPDTTVQISSNIQEYENIVTVSTDTNIDGYQSVGPRSVTATEYKCLKLGSIDKNNCPDYVNL